MTSSISIASTIWISHHCWFLHGLFATESGTTATHCKSAVIHYLVCYYFLYLIWFCGSCGVSSDSIISHFVVVCWQAGTNTDGYAHMNLRFTHKTTTIVYMCNVFWLLSIVVVVVAVFVVVAYVFFIMLCNCCAWISLFISCFCFPFVAFICFPAGFRQWQSHVSRSNAATENFINAKIVGVR